MSNYRIYIIADEKVIKTLKSLDWEQVKNLHVFRHKESDIKDFLGRAGIEFDDSIEAVILADECDKCHKLYDLFDWSWYRDERASATPNEWDRYLSRLTEAIQNVDPEFLNTEWSSSEDRKTGKTKNFCEDCYCNYSDEELGVLPQALFHGDVG